MPSHKGSCHCGAVEFEVEGDITSGVICDCSLCKRKGAIMHRIPNEQFRLIKGENDLTTYQWNTRVAKHYFCKHCGIYTHHQPRTQQAGLGCRHTDAQSRSRLFRGKVLHIAQ